MPGTEARPAPHTESPSSTYMRALEPIPWACCASSCRESDRGCVSTCCLNSRLSGATDTGIPSPQHLDHCLDIPSPRQIAQEIRLELPGFLISRRSRRGRWFRGAVDLYCLLQYALLHSAQLADPIRIALSLPLVDVDGVAVVLQHVNQVLHLFLA